MSNIYSFIMYIACNRNKIHYDNNNLYVDPKATMWFISTFNYDWMKGVITNVSLHHIIIKIIEWFNCRPLGFRVKLFYKLICYLRIWTNCLFWQWCNTYTCFQINWRISLLLSKRKDLGFQGSLPASQCFQTRLVYLDSFDEWIWCCWRVVLPPGVGSPWDLTLIKILLSFMYYIWVEHFGHPIGSSIVINSCIWYL